MYLITDDQVRASQLLKSLGPDCALEAVMLDDLRPSVLAGRAIVWDVDLQAPGIFETVRGKIAEAGESDQQSIFLVSGRFEAENTQAWALGATVLVPRGRATSELPAQLSRLLAAAVKAALDGALAALDSAFAATALNKAIARSDVTESSSVLVNTIADAGLNVWHNEVWSVDEGTSQHCLLVAGAVAGFALHMGFPERDTLELTHAAMLHDVGKARVPLSILNKPGKLDEEERAIIETHPRAGWECLKRQGFKDKRLLDAVLHHHEYLDGTGYPDGLSGRGISDFVRIITLCDIFGALSERRSYKSPHTPEAAIGIMREMGRKLDPDLLREFARYVRAAFPEEANLQGEQAVSA